MANSPEQSGSVLNNECFRPSKINDPFRIDLIDGHRFIAIDAPGAHEIDDAIRIRRLRGGFLMQVAIADGTKLAEESNRHIVEKAINKRENRYCRDKVTRRILPKAVSGQLSLQKGTNDALVISQKFTDEGEKFGNTEIFPALVNIKRTTYQAFGQDCVRKYQNEITNPYTDFYEIFRRTRNFRPKSIGNIIRERGIAGLSQRIVSASMILANISLAQWAQTNSVPILFREFSEDKEIDEDDYTPIHANYSPNPELHCGIPGFNDGVVYTHATSPLRRAADLVNHLQVAHALANNEAPFSTEEMKAIIINLNKRPKKTKKTEEVAIN